MLSRVLKKKKNFVIHIISVYIKSSLKPIKSQNTIEMGSKFRHREFTERDIQNVSLENMENYQLHLQ